MFTVQLDENKYFTGSYAKIGSIPGGVRVNSLPPDLENNKTTCWKYGEYQVDVEIQVPVQGEPIQVPVIDEETQEQKVDELGELVFEIQDGEVTYESQIIKETRVGWIFDKEKHQKLLKEIAAFVPELTNEEKIAMLEKQNEELCSTMDSILTDIIPGIMGSL